MKDYTPDYEEFAPIYDRFFGDAYLTQTAAAVSNLLLPNVRGTQLLDVGCGPGHVASWFADRGFAVTGIDTSARCLELARSRVPTGAFRVADARQFCLKETFDVIISTGDCLNHILDGDEIIQAFANFYRSLKDGGCLFFDVNMREGYEARWGTSFFIKTDDIAVLIDRSFEPATDLGRYAATVFEVFKDPQPNQLWSRRDVELLQRCYSREFLRGALSQWGFGEIAEFDASTDLSLPDVGRRFYRCIKSCRV